LPFTDLHSHILPGFDDGASDGTEFLEMAREAVRGGTARMAATPHYDLENPGLQPSAVKGSVEEHQRLLHEEGIPLELLAGVEVRLNAGLYRLAGDGGVDGLDTLTLDALTLGGGRCLLVDLPLIDMPTATADILFKVQLSGVLPILAHPERNRILAARPGAVRELTERGIEIQVNSGSLEGLYGKTARRSAFTLLGEGIARLVASDAHKPNGRSADLSGAASILRERFGDEAARVLLEVNPERVLAGEDLVEAVPRPTAGRGRKRFFTRGRSQ
jgi:protein-tyrosine phosphatase